MLPLVDRVCSWFLANAFDHKDVGRAVQLASARWPEPNFDVTRVVAGLLPDEHTVYQEGDLLHMMVRDEDLENVEKSFSHSPEDAS